MEKSVVQRIKELDAEGTKLLGQAKEEALRNANEAVSELNALGFNYQLTTAKRQKSGVKMQKSGAKKELEIKHVSCAICGFATSPPHDMRSHRSQKKKAPLTAAELGQKGLVRV
jgi:ribosomal protein L37E